MFDILRKEKVITLKLCPLIEHEISNIFMEKSFRKWAPEDIPDPFLILVNNSKQPLHARNLFKYIFKKDYQKNFKKLTLFFFWTQSFSKTRGLELVTSHSSGYKKKFIWWKNKNLQGLIQAAFDIGKPLLGTLIWACPNLISSKTETIIERNSSFFIKSAM